MNLKQKLVSSVGILALSLSMTAGIASAGTTDTADTVLDVDCPTTTSVDVNTYGSFHVDASVGATTYNANLDGGFEIVLDMTCNWSSDFEVGAEIGTFTYDGTAPTGTVSQFGGSHLLLTNGSGSYDGPDVPFLAGSPNIEQTVFELFYTEDPDVIENAYDIFIIVPVAIASPGVTSATWDGQLSLLPPNLADGTYVAPLTVTLSVN